MPDSLVAPLIHVKPLGLRIASSRSIETRSPTLCHSTQAPRKRG
jgi:hypothetical protein